MTFFLRPHWIRLRLSSSQLSAQRFLSSTYPVHQAEEEKEHERDEERGGTDNYDAWIRSEGRKWQYPDSLGPKWLGGNVPFPRNPTFKPPTPISDNLRKIIYHSYVTNPTANDPHTLSTRYGVSIQRIEAIIRLKHLETQWEEVSEQANVTLGDDFYFCLGWFRCIEGFRKGMERILGVKAGRVLSQEISSPDRNDVNEADELSRRANEDGARKRGLARTFFEAVEEGQEAVVPRLLEEHREKAATARQQRTEYPTIVVQPNPVKPAVKFVDVGLRWFDAKDVGRRQKESVRRKAIKAGKKKAKLASISPSVA